MDKSYAQEEIARTWEENAFAWKQAIDEGLIASRTETTNRLILDAVCRAPGDRVLDIGCGEGWLMRALEHRGKRVTGIDGSQQLCSLAGRSVTGPVIHCSYKEFSKVNLGTFDMAVCNFSVIGEDDASQIIQGCAINLRPGGTLLIQTLHPSLVSAEMRGISGWQTGTWCGIPGPFTRPAPWYYRTLESWRSVLSTRYSALTEVTESKSPKSGSEVSLLLKVELR